MKKLIAYSSVAHMGFVTIGIFSANQQGVDGAIFQMLSHGFISAALFLRCRRDLRPHAHAARSMPTAGLSSACRPTRWFSCCLPWRMSGFPELPDSSESSSPWSASSRSTLGLPPGPPPASSFRPGYALWLYRRVIFGDLVRESLRSIQDMDRRERLVMAPLVVMTVLLGVYPALVLDVIGPTVSSMLEDVAATQEAARLVIPHPGLAPVAVQTPLEFLASLVPGPA